MSAKILTMLKTIQINKAVINKIDKFNYYYVTQTINLGEEY